MIPGQLFMVYALGKTAGAGERDRTLYRSCPGNAERDPWATEPAYFRPPDRSPSTIRWSHESGPSQSSWEYSAL